MYDTIGPYKHRAVLIWQVRVQVKAEQILSLKHKSVKSLLFVWKDILRDFFSQCFASCCYKALFKGGIIFKQGTKQIHLTSTCEGSPSPQTVFVQKASHVSSSSVPEAQISTLAPFFRTAICRIMHEGGRTEEAVKLQNFNVFWAKNT